MKPLKTGGDIVHTIEVPAKFARHRDHYIRGYMQGYTRIADALEARRRSLAGKKEADEARKKPESRLARRLRTGV
jgi:hypothetical protein